MSKAAKTWQSLTPKGQFLLISIGRTQPVHLKHIDNRVLNPLRDKKLVLIDDKGYVRVSAKGRPVRDHGKHVWGA
jgi:hypothetical protein